MRAYEYADVVWWEPTLNVGLPYVLLMGIPLAALVVAILLGKGKG